MECCPYSNGRSMLEWGTDPTIRMLRTRVHILSIFAGTETLYRSGAPSLFRRLDEYRVGRLPYLKGRMSTGWSMLLYSILYKNRRKA